MSRHRNFRQPERPRPQVGQVFSDSIGREHVVVQPGAFSVTVRQLASDGSITKTSITLSLDTLKATDKKVNITIEDLK